MKTLRLITIFLLFAGLLGPLGCVKAPKEKPIAFIYTAFGASDATGVGAFPLTEGYVFLIKAELDKRIPGVALLNLGIPGARIDLIKEAVRAAAQIGTKANLVTLWTGANDLIRGDSPQRFQEDFRFILHRVKNKISSTIVVANLPDLTALPRFRSKPNANVTMERVRAFNQAIEEEARAVEVPVVGLFAETIGDDLVSDIDGFHPNDAGHRRIAQLFLAAIVATLPVR
jgi:acyl-CoA thioesterase-1